MLDTAFFENPEAFKNHEISYIGLPRFPESVCNLTELRRLDVVGHLPIAALPANISSLKELEELTPGCSLSSLPKELVELPGLMKVDLEHHRDLGNVLQDESFPAELGNMKSLRVIKLAGRGLRTVPAFVVELESLEILDLSDNDVQISAKLDFMIKECSRMREVRLYKG